MNSNERSSTSEQSLSSNSSVGSFNDFGLPSVSDSGSDISGVEFGQEGKYISQNETATFVRVRETYTDHSTIDVHTLKDYAEANFGSVNIEVMNSKQKVIKTISTAWSHQTVMLTKFLFHMNMAFTKADFLKHLCLHKV